MSPLAVAAAAVRGAVADPREVFGLADGSRLIPAGPDSARPV